MFISKSHLAIVHTVYNGETHDTALRANEAFDRRAAAAESLAKLFAPSDTPEETAMTPWKEIALEAGNLSIAIQNFEHLESLAASYTPSREVCDVIDGAIVAEALATDYSPLVGSGM